VGTERAQAAGLRCRPVAETVADTWAWLRDGGADAIGDWRAENRPRGLSPERERALLRSAG
jgi:2'-hydroxyisoflavone reductase